MTEAELSQRQRSSSQLTTVKHVHRILLRHANDVSASTGAISSQNAAAAAAGGQSGKNNKQRNRNIKQEDEEEEAENKTAI